MRKEQAEVPNLRLPQDADSGESKPKVVTPDVTDGKTRIHLALIIEPTDACQGCGDCCRTMPGQCTPQDFGFEDQPTQEHIAELHKHLDGGWIIDWWEGEPPTYYVRARATNDPPLRHNGSWRGQCSWLGDTGCTAPFKPSNCADIMPSPTQAGCVSPSGLDKLDWAETWDNWQDVLREARCAQTTNSDPGAIG